MSWVKFQSQDRPRYVTSDRVKNYLSEPDAEADAAAREALREKVRAIREQELKDQERARAQAVGNTQSKLRMWRTLAITSAVSLVIVMALTVVSLVREQQGYRTAIEEYDSLSNEVVAVKDFHPSADILSEENTGTLPDKYPNLVIDFERLMQINDDFIGWLYFPALDISYPVVQEDVADEYLRKTYGGKKNKAGAIYMDILSDGGFDGLTDFIFGHNMANGTMFGTLKNLGRSDGAKLIEENPYLFIYTEEKVIGYRVFAYFKTDVRSDVYNEVETEADYEKFLKIVRGYNMYEDMPTLDFSEKPEILTLSTCSGSAGTKQRFLVSTVKLVEWEYPGGE